MAARQIVVDQGAMGGGSVTYGRRVISMTVLDFHIFLSKIADEIQGDESKLGAALVRWFNTRWTALKKEEKANQRYFGRFF